MWRKHFKVVSPNSMSGLLSPVGSSAGNNEVRSQFGMRNYQNRLPEVYVGHPNRIERYNSYEQMDNDSEINAALDILAEFCSQPNIENGTPFQIKFKSTPSDSELKIIKEQLQQWCSLNELNRRAFKIVRNTLKYGDQVFIRDPETYKLLWVEMSKLIKVIVNESDGKKPEQYVVKDLNPNFQNLSVTAVTTSDSYQVNPNTSQGGGAYTPNAGAGMGGGSTGSRFNTALMESVIDAEHVVHLSLTEGLDIFWPFGVSVLETVFKVYKQKELLEDAILIYRLQRAPERRIFTIDVGDMPTHMAMAFVERVKNEVHQRRIPTITGQGTQAMDATYNPISQNEDFFFPRTADGRGSTVTTLPGGANIGEITDLRYFTNKMFRGLRIPSSYLPTAVEEASAPFSDGKVTTAMIQEWRFNQYCIRLQSAMVDPLDREFKLFMRFRGINIDSSLFELKFNEPQNFASYRQAEVDTARVSVFTQLEGYAYLSKRFLLGRYLGLSKEEIQENETMWGEEQHDEEAAPAPSADLRSVGVTPGGLGVDMETTAPIESGEFETGEPSGEMGPISGSPEAAAEAPAV